MSTMLFKMYPQYDVFYTGQFYNHKWYILCSIGSALLCFHFCYLLFNKYTSRQPVISIASILLLAIGIWMHFNMPTASYIISFPLLAIVVQNLLSVIKYKDSKYFNTLRSTFVLAIWCPILITLFLAFSIKLLFVPAIICLGIVVSSITFYPEIWTLKPVRYLGIVLFVLGLQ